MSPQQTTQIWNQETLQQAVVESLAAAKLAAEDLPESQERLEQRVMLHAMAPLACHPLPPEISLGRYVGFVDLRSHGTRSPIALALLVPPRYLRHDPDVSIITGHYGYLFGGCGFSSTVFSMHDGVVSGARCSQACVIMALAMLSDRNARVIGSYDISFLGRSAPTTEQKQPLAAEV